MASIQNDLRLFGIDLRHLGRELGDALHQLLQSPLLSWLSPRPAVRLHQNNHQVSVWLGGSIPRPAPKLQPKICRFDAIELPQDLFLQRNLRLPSLPDAQLRSALALEVQAASPFPAGDLVWGYCVSLRDAEATQLCLVLASRKQLLSHLSTMAPSGRTPPSGPELQPEVWALTDGTRQAVVLEGFGEQRRIRATVIRRNLNLGLLLTALLLLAAVALTPSAQLRYRALEAATQHAVLTEKTNALVQQRENLMQSAEQLNGLSQDLARRVSPLRVLEALTDILPDDTALLNFKLQGDKVTLMGLTPNASSLMQLLGSQTGFRDVRAPSAAVRSSGSTKEAFNIEFSLSPQIYGVFASAVAPDLAASQPVLAAAAASSAEPTPTPIPIPIPIPIPTAPRNDLPTTTSPPAVAPPNTATPKAPSFGGGPVFGGAPARPAASSPAAPMPPTESAKANRP